MDKRIDLEAVARDAAGDPALLVAVDVALSLRHIAEALTGMARPGDRTTGDGLVWWEGAPVASGHYHLRAVSARRVRPGHRTAFYLAAPAPGSGRWWQLRLVQIDDRGREGEPVVLGRTFHGGDEAQQAAQRYEDTGRVDPPGQDSAAPEPPPAVRLSEQDLTVDGIRFADVRTRDAYLAIKALGQDKILYLARSNGHQLKRRDDPTYLAVSSEDTNPDWVTGTAADIALTNGWIDPEEHDQLTR